MNDFNQSFKQPKKPDGQKKPDRGTDDQKREKLNRIIYITAVALLLAVVIIAAVVSAANRARKEPDPTPPVDTQKPNDDTKLPPSSLPPTKPEETPEETPAPTEPSEDVANKLPSFALPVKGALSVLHDPDLQVFSPTMNDYRVHLGIDVNTEEKAPVYAVAAGKVEKIWEDVRMGWCVAVSHSGKSVSYYKNLDKTLAEGVKEGADVKAGQLLGAVGDSAMIEVAQEPHLHFELTVGGLQVDPLEYFGDSDVATLKKDTAFED